MALRLVPREAKFFDMFAEMSSNLTQGARLLAELLADYRDVERRVQNLKDLEHRGDEMTHAILTKLNQTFITPFDREDIHRLASSMDDVLDFIYAASERLVMYKIASPPLAASKMADVIIQQTEEIAQAVKRLDKQKEVLQHCVEINRLENEGDRLARESIGELFENQRDPILLIKLKELYEVLEIATDKAEDVANVLESVVVKSA
jgi:predicted phosphate transport protein (TIGR00153 family)